MDTNLLLQIIGELKLQAISPLVTHDITASGTTYIIYRERQINLINGFLITKITETAGLTITTIIKTAFLPHIPTDTYNVEVYDAALIAAIATLTFG